MFAGTLGAYPSGAPFRIFGLLALTTNIRLGWKELKTAAYLAKS
jgi:hypothetical protein